MVLSIFHWLLIISIILLPFSIKWVGGMWRWIFQVLGKLFQFFFSIVRKIAELIWTIFKAIFKFFWMLFVKIIKGLFYLVPRLIYWLGLVIVESFKFFFYAFKSLVEILKP